MLETFSLFFCLLVTLPIIFLAFLSFYLFVNYFAHVDRLSLFKIQELLTFHFTPLIYDYRTIIGRQQGSPDFTVCGIQPGVGLIHQSDKALFPFVKVEFRKIRLPITQKKSIVVISDVSYSKKKQGQTIHKRTGVQKYNQSIIDSEYIKDK